MKIKIICIEDCELNWITFKKGEIYLYGKHGSGYDLPEANYFYHINGKYIGYVLQIVMHNFMSLAEYREKRIDNILND
jgi:hypothetical protein